MAAAARDIEDALRFLADAHGCMGNAADMLERVSCPLCESAVDALSTIDDFRDRSRRASEVLESA